MKRLLAYLSIKENRESMKHDAVRCVMLCHTLDPNDGLSNWRNKVATEHIATLCFITWYEEELNEF